MKKVRLAAALTLASGAASALPVPELAGAAIGVWELAMAAAAALWLFWPWRPSLGRLDPRDIEKAAWRMRTAGLAMALIASLAWIAWGMAPAKTSMDLPEERDERPTMLWSEEAQAKDPRGVEPREVYAMLSGPSHERERFLFLDARSPGERAVGAVPGFEKGMWAEAAGGAFGDLAGKTVVATCWTGMRGSEACTMLEQRGISCKYIKGGLKAWTAAGYPIQPSPGFQLEDVGIIEPYPGLDEALGPAEAAIALDQKGAVLVDSRSSEAYAKSHLRGAISLPIEELREAEIKNRVANLPPGPVLSACSGNVSCSMAGALGWEVWRSGGHYLGYYALGADALEKARASLGASGRTKLEASIWSKAQKASGWIVGESGRLSGSFALSLMALGVLLRFCGAAARTGALYLFEARARRIGGERLEARRVIKSVAMALVAALLMILLIQGARFGAPDTWWSDPMEIRWAGLLGFGLSVSLGLAATNWLSTLPLAGRIVYALVAWAAMTWWSSTLSVAAGLALGTMSVLWAGEHFFAWVRRAWERRLAYAQWEKGFSTLDRFRHVAFKPGKASRLSQLMATGLDIPDGFVVKASALRANGSPEAMALANKWGGRLAVRSNALVEDAEGDSMAGMFLSVAPSSLGKWREDALSVFGSYGSNMDASRESVLIQRLVEAECSGAAYSRHPGWGGCSLIEWGGGLGGMRMSGEAMAKSAVFERSGGTLVWSSQELSDKEHLMLSKVRSALAKVEGVFGDRQDMEWAWDGQIAWVVQARPQTGLDEWGVMSSSKGIERERARCLESAAIAGGLYAGDIAGLMPAPTALGVDLAARAWRRKGPGASAAAALGLRPLEISGSLYAFAWGKAWETRMVGAPKVLPLIGLWIAERAAASLALRWPKAKIELADAANLYAHLDWSRLGGEEWARHWEAALDGWDRAQAWACAAALWSRISSDKARSLYSKVGVSNMDWLMLGSDSFRPSAEDCGHRAWSDYEISAPSAREAGYSMEFHESFSPSSAASWSADGLSEDLAKWARHARRASYEREERKHEALRFMEGLRNAAKDADLRLNSAGAYARDAIALGQIARAGWPASIESIGPSYEFSGNIPTSLGALECALLGRRETTSRKDNESRAMLVSGGAQIKGVSFIANDAWNSNQLLSALGGDARGIIVFCSAARPDWMASLARSGCAGVCSRSGSWLAHPSAMAREHGVPMAICAMHPNQPGIACILNDGEPPQYANSFADDVLR